MNTECTVSDVVDAVVAKVSPSPVRFMSYSYNGFLEYTSGDGSYLIVIEMDEYYRCCGISVNTETGFHIINYCRMNDDDIAKMNKLIDKKIRELNITNPRDVAPTHNMTVACSAILEILNN